MNAAGSAEGQEEASGTPATTSPELPAEGREALLAFERKCTVFIFPQLLQLGAKEVVDRLRARAGEMAGGDGLRPADETLAGAYRELLKEAQSALREARAAQVAAESEGLQAHRRKEQLESGLQAARGRLPAARMTRLQQQLAELDSDVALERRLALIEAAVGEWERLSQVRQAREAERLADRAHVPLRPRQLVTARSRRARRDQALVVELARSFSLDRPEPGPEEEVSSPGQ